MRFSIVKTVFFKELRETLRDRRSLAVMFGIPLVIYPLITLAVASLAGNRAKEMSEQPLHISIQNGQDAPHLIEMIKQRSMMRTMAPGGAAQPGPQPSTGPATQPAEAADSPINVVPLSADPRADLRNKVIDVLLIIPDRMEARALDSESVEVVMDVDRSRSEAAVVERKMDRLLDAYQRWIIEQRLADKHVRADVLEPVRRHAEGIEQPNQRLGLMLAMMLPNVLLLTGMLGAFFPALNATTTEREAGTLETLLVTPAGRGEILIAKGALVLLSSLATAALNLISMSLVLWRVLSLIGAKNGAVLELSYGALAMTFLAAVPAMVFFAAIVMVVGLFARNFREANAFATPVMLIPLISVGVSIAEPAASIGLLLTPVVSTTLVIREVLTGHADVGHFLLAFISSCVYAVLMLNVAARLFTNEQLVNPSWEPLSFKGLSRNTARRRMPTIDEAIVLFVVTMLLGFYLQPTLLDRFGIVGGVASSSVLLLVVPALLFARIGRFDFKKAFSWFAPAAPLLLAAVLIGLGLTPISRTLSMLQQKIWPSSDGGAVQLLQDAMGNHALLVIAVVGLSAGICEELLYRGPIQAALLRKLRVFPALLTGAVMFAAAHLDLQGLAQRTALGLVLAWMVWRGRSIFPAILAHALFDAGQLAYLRIAVPPGTTAVPAWIEDPFSAANLIQFAVGAGLVVAGLILYRATAPAPDSDARGFAVLAPAGTSASPNA